MKNKENVYNEEEIEYFFNELIKRKRYDEFEIGLQASGLITKNNAAFKITEEDGKEPHMYAEINLNNYIKTGENRNIIDRNTFNYNKYKKELLEVNNSLCLRVTDSDILVLAFTCYDNINSYQLKIIKKFVEIARIALNNNKYENINIGISTKNIHIPFNLSIDRIDRQLFIVNRKTK